MSGTRVSPVFRYLRTLAEAPARRQLSDAELLGRFAAQQDEAAFAVLMGRHGGMVLGVCRRILRNEHDAEEAFQATFLVLVRKAESIMPRHMVANWLYGVAFRTALKSRASMNRRRAKERQAAELLRPEAAADPIPEELIRWLDQKMAEHGEGKLIPPTDGLQFELAERIASKVRAQITERILREAGFEDQVTTALGKIEVPIAATAG